MYYECDFYNSSSTWYKSEMFQYSNYGAKADRKSNRIFEPVLKNNGIALLTIDDHSCRTLFNQNGKGIHQTTNNDVRDILDAFDTSEITL